MTEARHFVCPQCAAVNRVSTERIAQGPVCGSCKTALGVHGEPVHLDDDLLEKVLRTSPVPVLVDFWADWCGPCRTLGPTLEQLAKKHAGTLVVAKVDTDAHTRLAAQYGVQSIPAVFLFRGGQLVAQEIGARPLPYWERWVGPHL